MREEAVPAERMLLGSMLLEPAHLDVVTARQLRPNDFEGSGHEVVFRAILELHEQGQSIDSVTAAEWLNARGELSRAGGYEYLDDLTQGIPRTGNLAYYLDIVQGRALRRRLQQLCLELRAMATRAEHSSESVIEAAIERFRGLEERVVQERFADYDTVQQEVYRELLEIEENPEMVWGVRTGFEDLDRDMRGFHPGELVVLAARPSMGKTALALVLAQSMAMHRSGVVFFTLEMPQKQLQKRLLSINSEVNLSSILRGNLKRADWDRINHAVSGTAPGLFWCEQDAQTVHGIRAKLKSLSHRQPISAVVIDYLQLMQADEHGGGRSRENRTQEVGAITRGLKLLAKEFHVPVILLSQLNRDPEKRKDKRPQLSDLRDSGSIEQDADLVWFLYRPDYYEAREHGREEKGLQTAEFIIAKNRNGPTGTYRAAFWRHYTKFTDVSEVDGMSM